ncbi:MAG TPA: SGNH/GDSL hydrolase family protein, partial [Terriglobales bacterium]|nr:SGNH/GDSL hydrolase family protein [Terriglobales bacterium]
MKRALINTALVLASLVVGLLVSEIALRLIGFDYPPFWRPDPVTGLALRPNTSGWFRKEGEAYVSINSNALRDRERPVAKPPGTYRIVVLGDSYAEALQVDVARTFWRLLEKQLQACDFQPGKQIDVINLGTSGFGTAQELRALQTRGLAYSPDLILLAFFAGNDIRNNSRELETEKLKPFYFLDDTGSLHLDDSFASSAEFQRRNSRLRNLGKEASKYLRTLQLVYYAKDVLESRVTGEGPAGAQGAIEPGLDDQVFATPQNAQWRNAWRVTERLITEIKRTASSAGSEFLLSTLSVGIQVHPDRATRDAFAKKLGVPDLFYPERRLLELGRTQDIRVIALAPELLRRAEAGHIFLHGFSNTRMGSGHWNEAGHAAAADLLAEKLCRDKGGR